MPSPTIAPDAMLQLAREITVFRGLEPAQLQALLADMQPVEFDGGGRLVEQGDDSRALFVLLEGELCVDLGGRRHELRAPTLIGEIQALVGGRRSASICALSPVRALRWEHAAFEAALVEHPSLLPALLELARTRLSRDELLEALSAALGELPEPLQARVLERGQRTRLTAGETLFEAGDAPEAWYIVLRGTLRVQRGEELLAECGPGSSLGELALLTQQTRAATVSASSACELLRIPEAEFRAIVREFPEQLCARISAMAAANAQRKVGSRAPLAQRCIAAYATSPGVDAAAVSAELMPALEALAPTLRCDRARLEALGFGLERALQPNSPADELCRARLHLWLEERAHRGEVVLFVIEHDDTELARFAAEWANHLLILADASGTCEPSVFERELSARIIEQRTLLLLHPEHTELPEGTRSWLEPRELDLYLHARRGTAQHFIRVARHLLRRPVCLALGGGGARGFAHLGVARALADAKVPVDAICGVSFGAVIGACLAAETSIEHIVDKFRELCRGRKLVRFNLPILSLLSDAPLRLMNRELFASRQIEDLWIPFMCYSANLTQRRLHLLERGSIATATRASCSLPMLLPPVVIDNEVHVDGGLMVNVPSRITHERWGGTTLAINVSGRFCPHSELDELPGPWRALWARLSAKLLGRPSPAFPGMLQTTAGALGVNNDERTTRAGDWAELLIQPPVRELGPAQIELLDTFIERGAQATRSAIDSWRPEDPDAVHLRPPPTAARERAPRVETRSFGERLRTRLDTARLSLRGAA